MTYMTTIILLGFGSVREGLWGTFVSPAEKTGFGGGEKRKIENTAVKEAWAVQSRLIFLKNC